MTNRRVLAFDMDGVLCDGRFIPKLERTPERYAQADSRLNMAEVAEFNKICTYHDVYVISSRHCSEATYVTRWWLDNEGLGPFAGVICNVMPKEKADLAKLLHATYLFDDNFQIICDCEAEGMAGVWCVPPNYMVRECFCRMAWCWKDILRYCQDLPGTLSYGPEQEELDLVISTN